MENVTQELFTDMKNTSFRRKLQLSRFGRGLPTQETVSDVACAATMKDILFSPQGFVPVPLDISNEEQATGRFALQDPKLFDACYKCGWIHQAVIEVTPDGCEIKGYIFPSPIHIWYSESPSPSKEFCLAL